MASEIGLVEADVESIKIREGEFDIGFETHWARTAGVKCPNCGSKAARHWCEPVADKKQSIFRAFNLVGDFYGEPFVPLDWVDLAIDLVYGVHMFDENVKKPGHYRLFQNFQGHIVRGAMKTTFLSAMIVDWLIHALRGRTAAFGQQNIEESLAKLVPMVLEIIEQSEFLEKELMLRWVTTQTKAGGTHRFTRGEGRGEVNLRLFSPANARAATNAKGYRCSAGFFDETGFMGEPTLLIDETVKKSNLTVPDPLWVEFSTMSPDPAHHQRRNQAVALEVIQNPALDPRMYAVVIAAPPTANVEDPETAIQLNALFKEEIAPKSIIHQELREARNDAAKMTIYARERCGWAGDYSMRFMDRDAWVGCAAAGGRQEVLSQMAGTPIVVGLDFSQTSDLSAAVLTSFRQDGTMLVCPYHFVPDIVYDKLNALTRGRLADWNMGGWIERLPAGTELPERVAARVLELVEPLKLDIIHWGYDRWSAEEAAILIRQSGWEGMPGEFEKVTHIQQGGNLNSAIKQCRNLVDHKKVLHTGDPVMDFCVLSAYKEVDTRDPDKERLVKIERGNAIDRIDGAVAWCTAVKAREDRMKWESRHQTADWSGMAEQPVLKA